MTDENGTEKPKRKGASAEHMREITRKRMEMAKTDPSKRGGRPRTRFTKAEATEAALQRLEPVAIKVLEGQLESEDERIKQNAAKLLLEWRRGKPSQSIKQTTDTVTRIVYESAAYRAPRGEVIEHEEPLELEEGEERVDTEAGDLLDRP